MTKLLSIALISCLMTSLHAGPPATMPISLLERLKTYAGEWKAKSPGGNEITMTAQVVSNGTAFMETLHMEGEMVTVYHMNGADLMMTHYCAVGNQPRMKAKPGDGKTIEFEFVDATNMSAPTDGHMHKARMTMVDEDHYTQEWTYFEDGKETGTVKMEFERVKK